MSDFHDVTPAQPCPGCGKSTWCAWGSDGYTVRCMRNSSPPGGYEKIKTNKDGGTVFRQIGAPRQNGHQPRSTKSRTNKRISFTDEFEKSVNAITAAQIEELAHDLGVKCESLKQIGVGWADEQFIKRHKVGWSGEGEYPTGAWVFPERDESGQIIGLCFRSKDGRKGTASGSKRGLTIPQGVDGFTGPTLLVEGPSDVAACLTMGIRAIGRPSNKGGVEMLTKHCADQDVVVVGENDTRVTKEGILRPGQEGAEHVARALANSWQRAVKATLPPKGTKDVRAWLNNSGADLDDQAACVMLGRDLLARLNASAKDASPEPPELKITVERDGKRTRATVKALLDDQIVFVDSFDLSSSKRRQDFAEAVSQRDSRVDAAEVSAKLLQHATKPKELDAPPKLKTRKDLVAELDAQTESLLDETPRELLNEARKLLQSPALLDTIVIDIAQIGVVGERELAATLYLIMTSRLLGKPLSGEVQGLSSSGKSFVIESVGKLMPAESLFVATDITANALYYLPNGKLIHRAVLAGERARGRTDDRAEATRALREMISSHKLSKAVPMKIDGKMETVLLQQDGPIAFIESTTQFDIFDEDANRMLPLATDDGADQTKQIVAAMAKNAAAASAPITAILARHHAMQRLLKRVKVTIPFAEQIAIHLTTNAPQIRRAFGHVLQMINVVALLHQYQRIDTPDELDHGTTILATLADYKIAYKVLGSPLGRSLGGALPPAVKNLGQRIIAHWGDQIFSTTDAIRFDGVVTSRGKMNEYLKKLLSAGTLNIIDDGRGNKPTTWQVIGDLPTDAARWLPHPSLLEGVQCQK
jgi:hypothetical protein